MTVEIVVIVIAVLAFIMLLVFAGKAVHIVRPYQKALIERLGRYKVTVDSGLRIIVPFIDSIRRIDMREHVVDVQPQEVITEDNVIVTVDAIIYYEATDPKRLAYNVVNFELAVTKLAQTNLRNVIGDMTLDSALTSRDKINVELREVLDQATDKWGTRVVRVEIQRIDPPVDVVQAMHKQMRAERERRAVVTEAKGAREADITRAEGAKQAEILSAEADKRQQILRAEGEAEAIEAVAKAEQFRLRTVAEGEADATRAIFGAIHDGNPTQELVALRYFEALQYIANGRATKIFLPADTSGLFNSLAGISELFKNMPNDGDGGPHDHSGADGS